MRIAKVSCFPLLHQAVFIQGLDFFLVLKKRLPAGFLLAGAGFLFAGAGVPPAALAALAAPLYFDTNS